MADPAARHPGEPSGEELRREVNARAARRLRARRNAQRSIWFGLGTFGMIGWSVAVPTLIGVAIGWWLDSQFKGRYSCTLMCLVLGLAAGCLMAWQWIQRESREDNRTKGDHEDG